MKSPWRIVAAFAVLLISGIAVLAWILPTLIQQYTG